MHKIISLLSSLSCICVWRQQQHFSTHPFFSFFERERFIHHAFLTFIPCDFESFSFSSHIPQSWENFFNTITNNNVVPGVSLHSNWRLHFVIIFQLFYPLFSSYSSLYFFWWWYDGKKLKILCSHCIYFSFANRNNKNVFKVIFIFLIPSIISTKSVDNRNQ